MAETPLKGGSLTQRDILRVPGTRLPEKSKTVERPASSILLDQQNLVPNLSHDAGIVELQAGPFGAKDHKRAIDKHVVLTNLQSLLRLTDLQSGPTPINDSAREKYFREYARNLFSEISEDGQTSHVFDSIVQALSLAKLVEETTQGQTKYILNLPDDCIDPRNGQRLRMEFTETHQGLQITTIAAPDGTQIFPIFEVILPPSGLSDEILTSAMSALGNNATESQTEKYLRVLNTQLGYLLRGLAPRTNVTSQAA